MCRRIAVIGLFSIFLGVYSPVSALEQVKDITPKSDKDNDSDDVKSKNPLKKIQGNWSWLNHDKDGCAETVYALSDTKEDIYSLPNNDALQEVADDQAKPKPAKPAHKIISLDYHLKDGIVFLNSAEGKRHWLSAYRFADDDTLVQQVIYREDGHQYTPFSGDLPKWNEVSVQDGEDQLKRCGQEAEDIIHAHENPDEASSDSKISGPTVVPAAEDSSSVPSPATQAPKSNGLAGSSRLRRGAAN